MSEKLVDENSTTSPEEMSNRQLFFDAMMSFTVDLNVINDALENDPSLLTAPNQNGLIAIQIAAHRGLKPLIQLIADHGADLEVPTADGRTPVAIACQGGSLYGVHTFYEYGANMGTKDSYGRTLMHHAAAVGAVHIMHYLNFKCGLRYDAADDEGYTSLHLSAWNDHSEAVRYLLRNKRCGDVDAASRYGSTALGIAAKNGNYHISRLIIKSTKQNLLHTKDGNGLSPMDHARMCQKDKHQLLPVKMLSWTSEQLYKSYTPSYDTMTWYFILFLPGSSLTIASMIFTYVPYLFVSLPLCLLLVIVGFFSPLTSHRIPGDEALQNPAAMGAFITGLTLTLVCYFVKVFPRLWPSNLFWFLIVGIDYLLILYMYWKLEHTDPGFDSIGKTTSDGTPMTIVDVAKQIPHQPTPQYSFCTHCEIVLPEVSKHCKLCGRCCNGFDHHCLWLMTCIGCKNHRLFIVFLFLLFMDNFLFVRGGCAVLVMFSGTYDPWIFLQYGMVEEKFLTFLMLCNFITGLFVLLNFVYQLSIVSMRETTYFDSKGRAAFGRKRERNVTWMTRLTNLKVFFTSNSNWFDNKIRPASFSV